MPLWTDLITPAELTGYARESLTAYEVAKGSLIAMRLRAILAASARLRAWVRPSIWATVIIHHLPSRVAVAW